MLPPTLLSHLKFALATDTSKQNITNSSFPLHNGCFKNLPGKTYHLGAFGTQISTYYDLGLILGGKWRTQTTAKCQCHDGTIVDPPEYDKLNIPCQTVCRSTTYIALSRMCRKSVAYSCERVSSHKSLMRQVGQWQTAHDFSMNW